MNAPKASRSKEPFDGLDGPAVRAFLAAKGWPVEALTGDSAETDVTLGGELVAVVTVGPEGEAALDRIVGAHGNLPHTPTFTRSASREGERRTVRLFRVTAPREMEVGGLVVRDTLPDAENLHGHAGGVSILTSGSHPVPPRAGHAGVWARWVTHPAHHPIAMLPAYLADAARDPSAAKALATTVRPTPATTRELEQWETKLVRARGRTVDMFGNVMKIFRWAPPFAGRFRLNLMSQGVEFEGGALPEGRIGTFREVVGDAPWGGFNPSEASAMQAIRALAEERSYHPVKEYLDGLTWDGVPRLDLVATELLHAAPDPLTTTMVRRWFISAIARVLDPGCQVDHALILVGDQGLKKSSFFRALAGDWFGDTDLRIGDKDSYGQIHANWITEWAELDRITSQRHAGEVKSFVSRRADTFRPPYGRTTATYRRSCVIVGSTNENEFLTDSTGSRRFWIVRVPKGCFIDAELVASLRDQLWAEAIHRYRAGEIHYLTPDEDEARELAAAEFRVRDAWEEVVENWIENGWPKHRMDSGEKRLTTRTLLLKALQLEPRDMGKGVQSRLGQVMAALGYESKRERVPKAEAGLYPIIGSEEPAKLVNAWVLKGAPAEAAEASPDPFGNPFSSGGDDEPPPF